MKLLYVYMEFYDNKGNNTLYRGFKHFEVNLGKDYFITYKNNRLLVSDMEFALPQGFWGHNIYNVSTLAGDNGSGKSTILNCIIELLQQIYQGRILNYNKSILIIENDGLLSALHMPGRGKDSLEIKGKEIPIYILHAFEALSLGWASDAIMKTKMIYLTNTLNEEDYRRGRSGYAQSHWNLKRYTHIRNQFLYDCSTCGLMLSDYRNEIDRKRYQERNEEGWLSVFFAYEQYKQVKYVFDKRQYRILKRLKAQGYQVPVPKQLSVAMEPADFGLFFSGESRAAGFRAESREKTIMFPRAAGKIELWKKKIKDKETIKESDFFTDVLLYGLACNCVLSLLRSILLDMSEKENAFVDQINRVLIKQEQKAEINPELEAAEFTMVVHEIIKIYRSMSQENNSYLHQMERYYAEFIEYIFGERAALLSHFQMKASVQDYLGSDITTLTFFVALEDAEWFCEFLQKYRYTCNPHYYLNFSWGLSSGENNLLRLFTSFYYIFERDFANEKNGECKIYNFDKAGHRIVCDSIILIMDEADLTYHPDWQRQFISVVTAFLQEIYPPECCKEIQIVLSTHSPLLLGDMPQHNVIYLRTNDETGITEVDNSGRLETFGQNIHLILRDSFFLRKGTIGEFAGKKIQDVTDGLEEIRVFIEECKDGNIKDVKKEASKYSLQIEKEFYPMISLLAEGIIKAKRIDMSAYYRQQLESLAAPTGSYADMTSEQLQKEMIKIKAELEKRKAR